jgi:GNAT superfamily N-acetyltransferase
VTIADYTWFIDNAAIHVFDADGICGFSAGDPRDGSIWALFVDPDFEGHGIGRKLIAAACAALRAAGHATATLGTDASTRAERFYRRDGWIARGRRPNGELIFEKSLVD